MEVTFFRELCNFKSLINCDKIYSGRDRQGFTVRVHDMKIVPRVILSSLGRSVNFTRLDTLMRNLDHYRVE